MACFVTSAFTSGCLRPCTGSLTLTFASDCYPVVTPLYRFTGSSNTTSVLNNYITTMYWSVASLTSTGYGDVHATNNVQYMTSIFAMLLGQVLFGTALATIAATLGNSLQVSRCLPHTPTFSQVSVPDDIHMAQTNLHLHKLRFQLCLR